MDITLREMILEEVLGKTLFEEDPYSVDLTTIDPMEHGEHLEEIERENFPSYFAQDLDDVVDDWRQPGFYGVGLFDDEDNTIKGYIYGYDFTEDEMYDLGRYLHNADGIKIYNPEFNDILNGNEEELTDIFNDQTTFYIANFVISNRYRKNNKVYYEGLSNMIQMFFKGVKTRGYKYMIFEAMSDSDRFIINPKTGNLKKHLKDVGLTLIARLTQPNENQSIVVLSFGD